MIVPEDLDSTRWEELYAQTVEKLKALLPGWTDIRASDPAVTLIELIAYLADVQNYVTNTITDSYWEYVTKLLGSESIPLQPAHLRVMVHAEHEILSKWTRIYAGAMPFEITHDVKLLHNEIKAIKLNEIPLLNTAEIFTTSGQTLTIHFLKPISEGSEAVIYFQILPLPERVSPEAGTPPPVCLQTEILSKDGWQEIQIKDSTCALLKSGEIAMTPSTTCNALRLTVEGNYDLPPILCNVFLDTAVFTQQRTCAWNVILKAPYLLPANLPENCELYFFTPEGEGWRQCTGLTHNNREIKGWDTAKLLRVVFIEPDFASHFMLSGVTEQTIKLDEFGILPESLCMMQREGHIWYDCPVYKKDAINRETKPRGCYFIESENVLQFGDGRDFVIPPQGEILIVGCAVTKGAAGNAVVSNLSAIDYKVQALEPATEGTDKEPSRQAFTRVAKEQEFPLRAITCTDLEQLAWHTPGIALDKVRAYPRSVFTPGEVGMVLVAKPKAKINRPSLLPWYIAQLRNYLEPFRMLSVPLWIYGPRYLAIGLSLRLKADPSVTTQQIRTVSEPLLDGVSGTAGFGARLNRAALFAALSTIPDIQEIERLNLYLLDEGGKLLAGGDIQAEPDVLPYLKEIIFE